VLSGAYRLSKRNIQHLLADCFGVELALGSISALESATSEALQEPVAKAYGFVQQQPVAHVDETGWQEANRRAWLWTAVTRTVTVFLIRLSRGSQVAKELLGETFVGIVVSDRWSGYRWIPIKYRQLCWAHLIRDLRQMAEIGGSAGAIGEALGMCARQLFHWWHRVRDGTLQRSSFRVYVAQLRLEVRALLREGASCEDAKSAALCRSLLRHEPALWPFMRQEEVELTNNPAEVRSVDQKPRLTNSGDWSGGERRELLVAYELASGVGAIPTAPGEGLRHLPRGSDWPSIREAGMNAEQLGASPGDTASTEG